MLWYLLVSWIPTMILHGLSIFIYSIYAMYNLSLKIQEGQYGLVIVFHLIAFLFYYSLMRVSLIEPGSVKEELIADTWKQWDDYLTTEKERVTEHKKNRKTQSQRPQQEDHSVVNYSEEELDEDYQMQLKMQRRTELLEKPGKRFCRKCFLPKPARTHHCNQCKSCWQRMDHHCQWVNNCVAINNYKFFFVMLFYASTKQLLLGALLIFVAVTNFQTFLNSVEKHDFELFLLVLHYYLVLLMTVLITGFMTFHLFLILQNKTTLEYLEKKKDGDSYGKGIYNNICEALGSNALLWLLPI